MVNLLLIAAICIDDCHDRYLQKVLESSASPQYFVFIKAEIRGVEREIGVTSYHLYRTLKARDKKFSDARYYQSYVKEKVINLQSIRFTRNELKKMDAAVLDVDSTVLQVAQVSSRKLLEQYFHVFDDLNYAVLRHDVPTEKIGTIMKVLFDNNFLMRMVEGRLEVEQLTRYERPNLVKAMRAVQE
jgi:hypothetical protein